MLRWLAAFIGLSTQVNAAPAEIAPLNQTNEVADHLPTSDLRCGALYAALKKLSEIGESGNAESYEESAALFVGFGVISMIESEGLDPSEAQKEAGEIVRTFIDVYWQRMVNVGRQLEKTQDFSEPLLEADLVFCLDRGEAYADGRLP